MAARGKSQRTAARTRKMRARNYHLIRIFIGIVIACVAFALGFAIRGSSSFLASLGFPESVTGVVERTVSDSNAQEKDVYNALSPRVSEVEDILRKDSVNSYNTIDSTASTIDAFVKSLKDSNLTYYTEESYNDLMNSPTEGYAGVGVLFSEYNGKAYAVDVFEGSPAQLEGVHEGDFVVSIFGDDSQAWSRSEVAAKLSQSAGADVVITWRRPETLEADGGDEFTTTLACKEYEETNVTSEYDKDHKVGYIKVKQLTQNSAKTVQDAIKSLKKKGAGAYVLDMRNNPGGYLSQAVDLASLFMSSGTVVQVQTKDGQQPKGASGQPATDSPLVVIANKHTAGAAEVVVAALKESQRADMIVGSKTLGKGSVQVLHNLSFGGALRYTAAYYLTPEGHAIDGAGVAPTVSYEGSENGLSVKEYAIERAGSLVTE